MYKSFFPKEFRPLFEYISMAAFKVVDWKGALTQFVQMSKRALEDGYARDVASENLKLFLPVFRLASSEEMSEYAKNTSENFFAERILDLYFSQFFSNFGMSIDLRQKNFLNTSEEIYFSPSPFVHVFEETFRIGMLEIYEGFYLGDSEKLEQGMLQVGLIKSINAKEIEETKHMLFSHFGNAGQGDLDFSLESFKSSFHELFLHLKKNNIKLSSDFLFLGIYLASLYLTMSKLNQAVDVKEIFLGSFRRNSSS